jgi:hypothetical protein
MLNKCGEARFCGSEFSVQGSAFGVSFNFAATRRYYLRQSADSFTITFRFHFNIGQLILERLCIG